MKEKVRESGRGKEEGRRRRKIEEMERKGRGGESGGEK